MMSKAYASMSREELLSLKEELDKEFQGYKEKGLKLDMSRGKPSIAQLNLSMGMMDVFHSESDLKCEDGTDCRNYGVLDGIPEAKRLLASIAEVNPNNIMIFGNSSLNVMYDTVARAYMFGLLGHTPWCKLDKVKFLCPAPGYDRHFKITETFGFDLITIPMHEDGPDMDMVEEYVNNDPAVKGIWCVPKYSNPQGYSYSDEVVRRFAALTPAAEDFRIFWDNAYSVHHLYEDKRDEILEILEECAKAGHPDMVFKFTSTSKISFPGSGVEAIATSDANMADIRKYMVVQTIGHDKLNQLRHVRFFDGKFENLLKHMKKHQALIRPKFDIVINTLEKELGDLGIATWSNPQGGYFISFNMEGCAKRIVTLCKEAGVVLTGAGASFPYGKDPKDENIRLSPTFPTEEELQEAMNVFVVSAKLAACEKLLAE